MKNILRVLLIAVIVLVVGAAAVDFDYGSIVINGNTLPYRILFPENYDESTQYPLFVFLHGAGERGNDNEFQLAVWGKDWLIDNFYSKHPAIVLVPQCPEGSFWSNVELNTIGDDNVFNLTAETEPTVPMQTLMALMRSWLASGHVSPDRVYVGGLSMGGFGTLELLWQMPGVVAAAVPICGGGWADRVVAAAGKTAIWLFHGGADPTVPVANSQDMYAALSAAGDEVKYTEYAGVGHESWVDAFEEPTLVPWIFTHNLTTNPLLKYWSHGSYMVGGNTLPYRIQFPQNYNPRRTYPLLVFLHGAGERGKDGELTTFWGKDFLFNHFYNDTPAIVVAPQCDYDSWWSNVEMQTPSGAKEQNWNFLTTTWTFNATDIPSTAMEPLVPLVRYWINSGRVNQNRVYLTGMSMGSMGAYELLWRMPNTFAAAFPICGGGPITKVVDATASTPMWIFHGGADMTIPVEFSRDMYAAMQAAGRDVQYTEYPGVDHDSWLSAWQEPELVPWMLSHVRTA